MTTPQLTTAEINKLLDAGVSEELLNMQLAEPSFTREDFLEVYQEDFPEAFCDTLAPYKKGTVFCPVCNEVSWNNRLNAHIFKCHMAELLAPFNKVHNKDEPIQHITVPLQISTPIYSNEKPETNTICEPPTQTSDINDPSSGHGQADRYLNPKTNRMKLIEKKRPHRMSKKDCPTLSYCLCCSKAWTSEKSARKHFFNTDGTPTACTSAKQLIQLNLLRGMAFAKYDEHAAIHVKVPTLAHHAAINKEVEVLELKKENLTLKRKLKEHVDIGIKKDQELTRLKAIIEKLEGKLESTPTCCASCLRKDVALNGRRR